MLPQGVGMAAGYFIFLPLRRKAPRMAGGTAREPYRSAGRRRKSWGDTYRQYWFDLGKIRFFCGNTLSALGCVIRGIAGRRKRTEDLGGRRRIFYGIHGPDRQGRVPVYAGGRSAGPGKLPGRRWALFREAGLGCEADYLGYQAFGPRRKGFSRAALHPDGGGGERASPSSGVWRRDISAKTAPAGDAMKNICFWADIIWQRADMRRH